MNKIVTLNALRGNSYSLFRKIPLMINMGVCLVFARTEESDCFLFSLLAK